LSWKHIPGLTNSFFLKLLFLEGFENISSNSYVIKDSILTIIDPGNDYTAFIELFELGFKPSDIKRVIITHGDFDHCMGTLELMRYPSIKMGGLEVILHEMGPATLKEIIEKEGGKVIEVKGGETLKLDDLELKVFYTPGHTIDSICLYHEPTRTLFTGDTVLPHAIAAPNPAARGSIRDYLSSLRILMKIPVEVILPGHGMPIIGNCKEAIESTYEGIIKDLTGEVEYDKAAETLLKYGYFEDAIFSKPSKKSNFKKKELVNPGMCFQLNICFKAVSILGNSVVSFYPLATTSLILLLYQDILQLYYMFGSLPQISLYLLSLTPRNARLLDGILLLHQEVILLSNLIHEQ
jgi:glyoxylase-like metal-dependent hydrolase (beta-lactamase superfamily II)